MADCVRLLQQRGILAEAAVDTLAEKEPLLAALSAASIQGQLATGPRAGHRVRRLLSDPIEGLRSGPLCFSARGFSLHAATRIKAEDRAGLERLCRYVTRPPLAAGRLQLIDADHLTFRLKTPWSDGTTHRLLSPLELIEKLAALIPPRRLNLVRYHGILAPNAHERSQTVPAPPSPTVSLAPGDSPAAPLRPPSTPLGGVYWRASLRSTSPSAPTEPPPLLPARAPPQQAWDFA